MVFADLKNDFVFRKVFGTHPDILIGLLNDLLDRHGEDAIEQIEYLPNEQHPVVAGAKLSILDIRCRDRSGAIFIVEIQLLHIAGFLNRVVYNACKAYSGQLQVGESYTKLTDVVAISICDFELWPDAPRDAAGVPRVPMVSRWQMTERISGAAELLQVQYVFLELPKLRKSQPETAEERWAWLFVNARGMDEIPEYLPEGPQRSAAELANQASFTELEMDAYRRVMDEIQQARDLSEERLAQGEARGEARGEATGKAQAVLAVLAARGIEVDAATRDLILACVEGATLDRWIARAATASSVGDVVVEAREA